MLLVVCGVTTGSKHRFSLMKNITSYPKPNLRTFCRLAREWDASKSSGASFTSKW